MCVIISNTKRYPSSSIERIIVDLMQSKFQIIKRELFDINSFSRHRVESERCRCRMLCRLCEKDGIHIACNNIDSDRNNNNDGKSNKAQGKKQIGPKTVITCLCGVINSSVAHDIPHRIARTRLTIWTLA